MVRSAPIPRTVVSPRISFFRFISSQSVGILFLCAYKLQTHEISLCSTSNKASKSLFFSILSDLHHKMRYVAPGKGKPLGLMPPSWDNSETSSQEDDKREARGFGSRKRDVYYDTDDEDNQSFMAPAPYGWTQPYLTMVTPKDEEEAKKPHGKGRMESPKLIATHYASPKRKHNDVDAGTYEEATAHTSTTKKVALNVRISVKPMDEWGFGLKDEPTSPVKRPMRTKLRLRLLEKHQNHELIHREIVHRRLLDLAEKKELNKVVKAMTEAVNTTRYGLQCVFCRISALEESNKKLSAAFSNAIPPP
jgi:hypothetical protein